MLLQSINRNNVVLRVIKPHLMLCGAGVRAQYGIIFQALIEYKTIFLTSWKWEPENYKII